MIFLADIFDLLQSFWDDDFVRAVLSDVTANIIITIFLAFISIISIFLVKPLSNRIHDWLHTLESPKAGYLYCGLLFSGFLLTVIAILLGIALENQIDACDNCITEEPALISCLDGKENIPGTLLPLPENPIGQRISPTAECGTGPPPASTNGWSTSFDIGDITLGVMDQCELAAIAYDTQQAWVKVEICDGPEKLLSLKDGNASDWDWCRFWVKEAYFQRTDPVLRFRDLPSLSYPN